METLSRRSISTSIACLFFLLSFGFWVQFLVRPSSPGPLLRAARFHTLGVWTWAVCGGGPALFGRLHQKLYLEAKRRPLFSDRVGLGWRSGGVIGSADVWQNHIGGGGDKSQIRVLAWRWPCRLHFSRGKQKIEGLRPPPLHPTRWVGT